MSAGNFRVVVLRKGSVIVSALTLRVCGPGFAEMPFVATREGTSSLHASKAVARIGVAAMVILVNNRIRRGHA